MTCLKSRSFYTAVGGFILHNINDLRLGNMAPILLKCCYPANVAQQCLDYWINSRIYFGQISASVKFAHLLKEKSSGVDVYETSKLQAKLPGNKADMPKCFHGVFSLFHPWCASAHWRYQKQRPIYAANILGAKKLSVRRFSRGQGINLQPYCSMIKIVTQSARKRC